MAEEVDKRPAINQLRMRGAYGEIRSAWNVAGKIGRWELDEVLHLTAPGGIVDAQEFWLMRGNLDLWLKVGNKNWWIWRAVTLLQREPLMIRVTGRPDVRPA